MKRRLFTPKWSEPCLCGSGNKYKNCCWRRLPGFDIGEQYTAAITERHLERALVACRADIVQYTIWHKSNTEPALIRGAPIEKLLKVDIDALAAYVERLFWLYIHTNRIPDWLSVLDRLRKNIQHPHWERKIFYFRALSFLGPDGDPIKAKQELAKVGPITVDEGDVDLLQIYIDLELDDQPFGERLKFIDRILQVSKRRVDQLQYRGAKAVQYLLFGDKTTAERELDEAIRLVPENELDDSLDDYERRLLGRLLQMLASLRHDHSLFRKALGHFKILLSFDTWTPIGRAMLFREIGDCHKYAGSWGDAERAYREALNTNENSLDRIHLAETFLYQKRVDEASAEIIKIDHNLLERHENEDYVFTFAAIATWSGKVPELQEAKKLLEELETTEPYFNERRLTLLLGITTALTSGIVSEEAKVASKPEGGIASASSNFLLLQPNFMGIGINFNAIIDYFLKKKPGS
jgi:tetratricopeptide (TPR) repeat protein